MTHYLWDDFLWKLINREVSIDSMWHCSYYNCDVPVVRFRIIVFETHSNVYWATLIVLPPPTKKSIPQGYKCPHATYKRFRIIDFEKHIDAYWATLIVLHPPTNINSTRITLPSCPIQLLTGHDARPNLPTWNPTHVQHDVSVNFLVDVNQCVLLMSTEYMTPFCCTFFIFVR